MDISSVLAGGEEGSNNEHVPTTLNVIAFFKVLVDLLYDTAQVTYIYYNGIVYGPLTSKTELLTSVGSSVIAAVSSTTSWI